jgi:hypothetical protein
MQRQIQQLRQLILDSQYAVDEGTVANAIITRATVRRTVMGTTFRNDVRDDVSDDGREPQVRSFRPTNKARSFRPCNAKGSQDGLISIPSQRRS